MLNSVCRFLRGINLSHSGRGNKKEHHIHSLSLSLLCVCVCIFLSSPMKYYRLCALCAYSMEAKWSFWYISASFFHFFHFFSQRKLATLCSFVNTKTGIIVYINCNFAAHRRKGKSIIGRSTGKCMECAITRDDVFFSLSRSPGIAKYVYNCNSKLQMCRSRLYTLSSFARIY